MLRCWIALSALILAVLAPGCDELNNKPGAQGKGADVGQKSLDHTRNAAGIAPPEGLQ